ncbi:MAG: hypothetical protein MJZ20_07040 [Bacteroidaceae bacterium]|nr:hypothetical protein [Bacteroidaceae bacterium]
MWKLRSTKTYKVGDMVFFDNDAFVYDRELKKVCDVYCYHNEGEPWAGTITEIPHYNFVVVDMCNGLKDILLYVDRVRSRR